MEIPHHITLHASFIVRISAEYTFGEASTSAPVGPPDPTGAWAIHGWMVLANSGESWRFTELRDVPEILARWIDDNHDKQSAQSHQSHQSHQSP